MLLGVLDTPQIAANVFGKPIGTKKSSKPAKVIFNYEYVFLRLQPLYFS